MSKRSRTPWSDRIRRLGTTLLVAAGLGTLAVAFTPIAATFSDGDVLSADELNAAINDNMDAVADALADLEARADALAELEELVPVAFGTVQWTSTQQRLLSGTDNVASVTEVVGFADRPAIDIAFDDIDFDNSSYTVVVTSRSSQATSAHVAHTHDDDLRVYLFSNTGDPAETGFHFVVHEGPE